jgi:hypothetical protein
VPIAEALTKLSIDLPVMDEAATSEMKIRAVLREIVERALPLAGVAVQAVQSDPSRCPNCDAPVDSFRTPYCGEHCRAMSAFVRQMRNSLQNESIFDPERQVGMGQALWNLQGGGFPHRQTLIPTKAIAKVIERDGGKCQVCGAPATEVDHTGSG